MEEELDQSFMLSPSQGVRLMILAELVRSGDIVIRSGWDADEDHEEPTKELLADLAQEIALQVGHGAD